jgi:hypothetical protein
MNAAAAIAIIAALRSARAAIRRTASNTMARTAALSPKKKASTGATWPQAA